MAQSLAQRLHCVPHYSGAAHTQARTNNKRFQTQALYLHPYSVRNRIDALRKQTPDFPPSSAAVSLLGKHLCLSQQARNTSQPKAAALVAAAALHDARARAKM